MADDGSRRTLSKTPDEVFLRHPEGEPTRITQEKFQKPSGTARNGRDRNPKNGVLSVDASINPLKGLYKEIRQKNPERSGGTLSGVSRGCGRN